MSALLNGTALRNPGAWAVPQAATDRMAELDQLIAAEGRRKKYPTKRQRVLRANERRRLYLADGTQEAEYWTGKRVRESWGFAGKAL